MADLSDMLLDKMPTSCHSYVMYVRAFASVSERNLDDYQGSAEGLGRGAVDVSKYPLKAACQPQA